MRPAKHKVRIRVPASTANLGPGFDCLGMALQLYNEFVLSIGGDTPLEVNVQGEDTEGIPLDGNNLVCRAMGRIFQIAGVEPEAMRLDITLHTPLARGLGSSASAIVGGMGVANAILGYPLSEEELLAEMIEMEGHPDNVVACFYGGLTASLVAEGKVIVRRYEPAETLRCVLVIPDYPIPTREARRVLPRKIAIRDAVFNISRIPFLLDMLRTGDLRLLDIVMDDRVHQPYRRSLIPDYDVIEAEAKRVGGAAVCISGAGPTLLIITDDASGQEVRAALEKALLPLPRKYSVQLVAPDLSGMTELEG
ncbi:MAG: homoserine kinase [Candidatus Sumerlaea chitinivorans]|nr:homoserine kinase [Candidatus Sumerlaea chitinivorans]